MSDDMKQNITKGMSNAKTQEVLSKVAQSGDAKHLMELLAKEGGVQDAANAAAGGNVSQLMGMVQRLMKSEEGAELINRISKQAKQSGLK